MSEETTVVLLRHDACDKIAKRMAPAKTVVPAYLRGDEAGVYATVMSGQEMGIGPMASLRAFHLIDGVPRLSADAMRAVAVASPHCEYLRCIESTASSCTWETKRRSHPQPDRYAFTIEQARRAGVVRQGSNWEKYPERMLSARASSFLVRNVYPDLLAGMLSVEEAEDDTGMSPASKASAIDAYVAPAPAPPALAVVEAGDAVPELSLTEEQDAAVSVIMDALRDAESGAELEKIHNSARKEDAPVFDAVAPHIYRRMIADAGSKGDLAWIAKHLKDHPELKAKLRDAYDARSAELAKGAP